MAETTKIEWAEATWNPTAGCSVVSPGCTNCYAMRLAGTRLAHTEKFRGLTTPSKAGPVWNGTVRLDESALTQPLRWKKPRRIFVNSMSDLFHENLPDEAIDKVFAVMAEAGWHTFLVLTKRAQRMHDYLADPDLRRRIDEIVCKMPDLGMPVPSEDSDLGWRGEWPLPNVSLIVSAEDQDRANERIPLLLKTPAALRGVSLEPLLGPIDLTNVSMQLPGGRKVCFVNAVEAKEANPAHQYLVERLGPDYHYARLDWVIVGGESGPGARPMHPEWPLYLRDQCTEAGVPFFFKQWGEWKLGSDFAPDSQIVTSDGRAWAKDMSIQEIDHDCGGVMRLNPVKMRRVGKRAAGRLLDGREWNEMPEVRRG